MRCGFDYDYSFWRADGGCLASRLDAIPGIGAKRKKALLKKFGSVEAIKEASLEELSQVRSIPLDLAEKIKEYL